MERTWLSDSTHDERAIEWLADLGGGDVGARIREALGLVADGPDDSPGAAGTALVAAECVAYLRGAPADLPAGARRALAGAGLEADRGLVDLAVRAVETVLERSELARWWARHRPERAAAWAEAVDGLKTRILGGPGVVPAEPGRRPEDEDEPEPEDEPEDEPETERERDGPGPFGDDAGIASLVDPEGPPPDLAVARRVLKLGLYAGDAVEEPIAWKSPAPGLIAVLLYDLPDALVPVPAAHAAAFGRPADELFEIALENIKAWADLKVETRTLDDGAALTALFGSDAFTAALALALGDYLERPAPHGALVGVPYTGAVLYHIVADARWASAARALLHEVARLCEGDDALSPHLYWWHDGRLTAFPAEVAGDAVRLDPPRAFLDEVVARL